MMWLFYLSSSLFVQLIKDVRRKKLATKHGVVQSITLEFIVAFLVTAFGVILFTDSFYIDKYSIIIFFVGVIDLLGSLGKTKALTINLASTSVTQSFSPIFPIILAVIFLGEFQLFNVSTTSGLIKILSLIIMPFALTLLRSDKLEGKDKVNSIWIKSILIMLFFHGLTNFLLKYVMVITNVLRLSVFHRFGKAVASFIVMKQRGLKLHKKKSFIYLATSNGVLVAITSLLAQLAIATAPLSVYLIIKKPSQVVLATLTGFFIYKENKNLSKKETLGFILAAIVLIATVATSI